MAFASRVRKKSFSWKRAAMLHEITVVKKNKKRERDKEAAVWVVYVNQIK